MNTGILAVCVRERESNAPNPERKFPAADLDLPERSMTRTGKGWGSVRIYRDALSADQWRIGPALL